MTLKKAKHLAKKHESEKRFAHTCNVQTLAVELATHYGQDAHKAALAAWLHDVAKEMPKREQLRILQDDVIIAQDTHLRPCPVWHGVCAAILAKHEWGITDGEVLSAIACHTTGKIGMSALDKIVYLADMLCAERDFEGVDALRALLFQDLDIAMCACLKYNLDYLKSSGKPVDPTTQAVYNDYQNNNSEEF